MTVLMDLRRSLALLCVVALVGLTGCKDDPVGLVIVSPDDGAVLTEADDVDSALDGIQFEVEVVAENVADGDTLLLFYDVDPSEELPAEPDDVAVVTDESARFTVTASGRTAFNLRASTEDRNDLSNLVSVEAIEGCGASVEFVSPTATGGSVTLGPNDDTTGPGTCDEDFTVNVEVSTNAGEGAMGQLFVNGAPSATSTVVGTVLRFEGVLLADGENELRVEVTNSTGTCDDPSLASTIVVDCDRPSCAFVEPETESTFLSAAEDSSAEEGFQDDFVIGTDAALVGREIELTVDGSALPNEVAMAGGEGAQAAFNNVSLAEGFHRFRAVCRDEVGNAAAVEAEWTVDSVACGITIDWDGRTIIEDDDEEPAMDGITVTVSGTVSGDDCVAVEAGLEGGALSGVTLDGSAWTGQVVFSSSPTQTLRAEVADEAGNIGEATVEVSVRTDAPQLEITSPSGPTSYNVGGTDGAVADLDTGTTACDAAVTVSCTDVGSTIELVRQDTGLVIASADCAEMAGLPAPFAGQAAFSSAPLPTRNDGGTYSLVARATVGRLTGTSSPVEITADCDAPELNFGRPMCGEVLRPAEDDESPDPGFQYQVTVVNNNTPAPPVDLEIVNGGGTVVYSATSSVRLGITNVFEDADFGSGGELTLNACATDGAGNQGCAPACMVTVVDLPSVNLTDPSSGVLSADDDCDTGNATPDIRVRATTDAVDGSAATVTIGGGAAVMTTVSGGAVDVCAPSPEGRDLVVEVAITDGRGTGTGTVTVTVDMTPPADPIDDLTLADVVDRRGGEVRFTWTAVDDNGANLVDYELRCADAAITDEASWDAAEVFVLEAGAPLSEGSMESRLGSTFLVEVGKECVLRGVDVAGALTPIGPSVSVATAFERQEIALPAGHGVRAVAVGDVNDDTFDDMLIAGVDTAYLYFGSATGFGGTPDVRIDGPSGFATQITGIGDFNDDGIADFGVSAPLAASFAGRVWLFYGRASWPAAIDITSSCMADACFTGPAVGFLGFSLASAGDHNGDGLNDVAIGGFGQLHVILGGSGVGGEYDLSADAVRGFFYESPASAEQFGNGVTAIPGTAGRTDLVVAAPGSSSTPTDGSVWRVPGRDYTAGGAIQTIAGSVPTLLVRSGAAGRFATGVTNIGDYDGGGQVDVAVYDVFSGSRGRVHILRGEEGFALVGSVVNDSVDDPGNDRFGNPLGLGWHPVFGVLADAWPGQIALLAGSAENGTGPGTGDVFFGSSPIPATRNRSSADVVFDVATSGAASLSPVGDLNGDGFVDLALGTPGDGRLTLLY